MKKERFEYLCQEAQSGKSAFISHGSTNEEGQVVGCSLNHLLVKTNEGNQRCWDFQECSEIRSSQR